MQSDLFHLSTATSSPFQMPRNSFFERFRLSLRFDHVVLLVILIVVFYTFVFSWGVEKGKREAAQDFQTVAARIQEQVLSRVQEQGSAVIDTTRIPELPQVSAPAVPLDPVEPARIELTPEPELTETAEPASRPSGQESVVPDGKYTVQLVAYTTESDALKQLAKLSEDGYQGFVIASGRFHQVCVNAFQRKNQASDFLKNLRAHGIAPPDAYVRNIPR